MRAYPFVGGPPKDTRCLKARKDLYATASRNNLIRIDT
jgi:hypothetical protein